jgi:hypothetical protein
MGLPSLVMASTSTDRIVRLRFDAPSYIDQVRLSNFADFHIASTQSYGGEAIIWDICSSRPSCTSGVYKVYVEFLKTGEVIKSLSDTVVYQAVAPVVVPPVVPAEPVVEPVIQPDPEPVVPEPIPDIPIELPTELPAAVPSQDFSFSITPAMHDAGRTIEIVGIGTTIATSALSLFGNAMSWSEFFVMLPMRLWNLLLILWGIRKKNKPWGMVYDSQTKQPLDPAYVTLLDVQGNEVATSITDIAGRYGFLVAPGRYHIRAGKTHYTFPSTRLTGKTNDVLYQDLYFGEEVIVSEDQVITKNIPMDSEFADWNQEEKKRMKVGYVSGVHKVFAVLSNLVMYTGLLVTIIFTVIKPSTTNFIFLGIYIVLFIARAAGFRPHSYGTIRRKDTKEGLSSAIVRIASAKLGREIGHAVADPRGHYYTLLPKGEYQVNIEEKKAEEVYEKVYTTPAPIITKKGILNKSFEV